MKPSKRKKDPILCLNCLNFQIMIVQKNSSLLALQHVDKKSLQYLLSTSKVLTFKFLSYLLKGMMMNQKKSLECLFVQNCYSLLLLIVRIIYTASHNNGRETFSAPCAKNRVYSLRRIYLRDKSFYRQSSKLAQTSLECLDIKLKQALQCCQLWIFLVQT